MRKLFIIATSLLIIGIGLPILAANNGDDCDKNKDREKMESMILDPDHSKQSDCKKKRRAKEEERALEERNANKAGFEGNPYPEKDKKNSTNPSFNFLYYLFYKSSINEFIKNSDYCQSTGSSD